MRSVLALALALLALTLLLNHSRSLFGAPAEHGELADRALEIVVGAKGPLLPAARIGSGPERIGAAIRIGDRTLIGPCRSGLRAAFVGPDLALREERCFDVSSPSGARALRAAVEDAGEGEVLVLASTGRLAPDAAAAAELERALAALGARARPGTGTPESWALLAVRLERGWVPLAEGYSRESGVALAFVLSPDLERYAGFDGDLVLARAGRRCEIELADELEHASARSHGIELARGHTVGGRALTGILLPPGTDAGGAAQAGRLAWSDVELGPGSAFVAWLGLADGLDTGSDGAECGLRVDGELVASRTVLPGAPWKPWQVDLRRFAGRRATLELEVEARGSATGDAVLWGRPLLVHGYERAPLEVWAEER